MNFYIDFRGYCRIEAENETAAEEKFWELVKDDAPLPHAVFEIEGKEETTDG